MKRWGAALFMVPLALLLLGAFAAQANAMTMAEPGLPEETGSWTLPWFWWPGPLFDSVEVFIVSPGVDFIDPGISVSQVKDAADNDLTALWDAWLVNPDYSLAAGVESQRIWYSMHFSSDVTDPLEFDYLLWNDGNFLYGVNAYWDGSGWTQTFILSLEGKDYDRTPVPEPSTLALLASGLIGLGGLRRLRRSGA